MPTSVTVVCLFLLLSEGIHGSQDISCNFKGNWCQWNSDENTTLQWKLNTNIFWDLITGEYHLELDMANAQVNHTGRLLSPRLQGSSDQTCQLRFIYSLENQTACQLSVLLSTQTDKPILLKTLRDTNTFDKSPYIDVPCTAESYQIIIEGKKVSNESCSTIYNKLGLYNLEYIIRQTTDGKRNSIGDNGHHSDDNEADEPLPDLSKWAFAGIAIAVYTVVIILAISLICLLRRFIRGRRKTNTNHNKSDQVICSVSNTKQHVQSLPASGSNDVNHYSTPDEKQMQDQTGGYATPAEPTSPYAVTSLALQRSRCQQKRETTGPCFFWKPGIQQAGLQPRIQD